MPRPPTLETARERDRQQTDNRQTDSRMPRTGQKRKRVNPPEVGDRVDVKYNTGWCDGEVTRVEGGQFSSISMFFSPYFLDVLYLSSNVVLELVSIWYTDSARRIKNRT